MQLLCWRLNLSPQISQGSASTYYTWSGQFLHSFIKCFFQVMPINFYWNQFIFDRHTAQNNLAHFWDTVYKLTISTKNMFKNINTGRYLTIFSFSDHNKCIMTKMLFLCLTIITPDIKQRMAQQLLYCETKNQLHCYYQSQITHFCQLSIVLECGIKSFGNIILKNLYHTYITINHHLYFYDTCGKYKPIWKILSPL